MKALLGGKGANLAEMTRIGLPVPPGFTDHDRGLHLFLREQEDLPAVAAGARWKPASPTWRRSWAASSATPKACRCWWPCRSGARDSMPGMMDTILNLGLNDQTVLALVARHEQRALRLGLLPPLHPDVRRRGARRAEARRRRSRAVRSRSSRASSTRSITRTSSTPT